MNRQIFTIDEKILTKVVSSLNFYLMCNVKQKIAAPCSVRFLKKLTENILTNGQIFVKLVNIFYRQNFMLYSIFHEKF